MTMAVVTVLVVLCVMMVGDGDGYGDINGDTDDIG